MSYTHSLVRRLTVFGALLLGGSLAHSAHAATYTVTSTADPATSDGVCSASGTGDGCTLREAIAAANANPGVDIVSIGYGGFGTITVSQGAIPITQSVTIQDSAPPIPVTISGNNTSSLFAIAQGSGNVTFNDLTLTNGGTTASTGGAIQCVDSDLTLARCVVKNCSGDLGGAIGFFNSDTSTPGHSLTLTDCTFDSNTASTSGGAIYIQYGIGGVSATRCTFSNNRVASTQYRYPTGGGAIFNYIGPMNFTQCTFSGNSAASTTDVQMYGGGIFNGGQANGQYASPMTMTNCTVASNSAANSSRFATSSGGGIYNENGILTLNNSIVAGNSAAGGADISTYPGNNPVLDHSLVGGDPQLGSLANNGGLTQTRVPLAGSPAIDAGNSTLSLDQRGKKRPVDIPDVTNASDGNGSDIGAVEYDPIQSGPSFVVTSVDDRNSGACGVYDCTLRDAINAANANADASTITFDPTVFAQKKTITLMNDGTGDGLPDIRTDLTIEGPTTGGLTLRYTNATSGGTLEVIAGTTTISNLTFQGGLQAIETIGVNPKTIVNNCTFDGTRFSLFNVGGASTTANNCTFSGNTLVANSYGYVTLNSCTIIGSISGASTNGSSATNLTNSIVVGGASNLTTSDHNLIVSTVTAAGLDPKGLQDNGGPTPTIALAQGSPALDAGSTTLATDQRGKPRPFGSAADIGAFEAQSNEIVLLGVTISPSAPKTNDTLTITSTDSDGQGTGLSTTYQWFKNGQALSGETNATLDLSKAGNGDKGDSITVTVTTDNGQEGGKVTRTSNAVVVVNSPPVAPNFTFTPTSPQTNSVLTAQIGTLSDPDNDPVTIQSYQWKKNGITVDAGFVGTSPITLDLSLPYRGDKGDKISLALTLSDGTTTVSSESPTVTIVDTAPVVSSVSIDNQDPKTNDTLTATPTAIDIDKDTLTYTYKWMRNGVTLDGETGATLDLSKAGNGDKGDQITVTVTANDGEQNSAPVTSDAVTIANSAPVVNTVALEPTGPKTDDPLTATATASDADSDSLTYTFTWARGRSGKSSVIRTQTNSTGTDTLTTAGSIVVSGDTLTVSVVANDGSTTSASQSASVTIGNTPVSIGNLTLSPTVPKTNSVLVVNAQLIDADGGRSTNTYVWTRTHAGQTTEVFRETTNGSQSRLDLSKADMGDKNDTITVTLTASDGQSSATKSASVKVANSLPTLSGLTLTPTAPTVASQVTATFIASDLDVTDGVDSFKYLFSWKAGGKSLSDEKGATVNLSKYKFLKAGDTLSLSLRVSDGTAISSTQTATVKLGAPTSPTKPSAGSS